MTVPTAFISKASNRASGSHGTVRTIIERLVWLASDNCTPIGLSAGRNHWSLATNRRLMTNQIFSRSNTRFPAESGCW